MMRHSRLLKCLLLTIIAPLLVLTGVEGALRILDAGYPTDFLIKQTRNGQAVWVDNPVFGFRFFSPALTRTPPPISVPADKDPSEFRLVVLGESAAMGEPEPAFGPARMLEKMLSLSLTGRTVRVINAAMTAINSHVITEIARELPKLEPDMVILYIGNNEVVGPFGPGTVINRYSGSFWLNRVAVLSTRLRMVSILRDVYFTWSSREDPAWQGMEMFTGQRVAPDDTRLLTMRAAFRRNLEMIIQAAGKAGARVLLSTIAVNLNDQAPLDGSAYDSKLSREELKKVRDRDQLRFRADSSINATIRFAAAENGRLIFADPEAWFDYLNLPDRELFLDHVHLATRGSYELARCWMDALGHGEPPALDFLRARVGWSESGALEVSEIMLQRLAREPFKSAEDFRSKMDFWTRARTAALNHFEQADAGKLSSDLDQLTRDYPDDPYYIQLAYSTVRALEDARLSRGYLQRLLAVWPHRLEVRSWQAIQIASDGDHAPLLPLITTDLPPLGTLPADLLAGVSEVLFLDGKPDAAIRVLREAAAHFPELKRIRIALASRLAQTGAVAEAENEFRWLMDHLPDDVRFREEYAAFLVMQEKFAEAEPLMQRIRESGELADELKWIQFQFLAGRHDEAMLEIQQALAEHPDSADTLTLAANMHARKLDFEGAAGLYEDSLKLEPWREQNSLKLAALYTKMGKLTEAVKAVKSALPYSTNPASLENEIRNVESN